MSCNYVLDSLGSMQQSSRVIAALPFGRQGAFARAALASEDYFETNLIRDAEPHELALFTTAHTRLEPADADSQHRWTATKRHGPRRAIGRDKASPLKERRGATAPDPSRALRAAHKLLEIYPLPRAQEHVDSLFDQFDGLVKSLADLNDELKRPISRQTVQTAEAIKAAEREDAIRSEEMELFALRQINSEKLAENEALAAQISARKATAGPAPPPAAAANPFAKSTIPSRPTAATVRPPPIKTARPVPQKAPTPLPSPHASTSTSPRRPSATTASPARPSFSSSRETTPTKARTLRASLTNAPRPPVPVSPKGKRPAAGIPMEDLDAIAAKIWNGVGDALRPWARKTLVQAGEAVPSPLRSLPFTATFKALSTVLSAPPALDLPSSPTSSFATLTSEAEDADPLPPTPAQLVEFHLLNLLLSTLSGLPPIASPETPMALPPLSITLRDAVLPSSLLDSGGDSKYRKGDKDPMVSMNALKAHLAAFANHRGWGADEMGTTAIYSLVSQTVLRIDRRGKEGPMLGFKA